MNKQREKWIDYIKLLACVLVAMGHFFMGLVEANILSESQVHNWFIRTIYYFHVPLFFLCSGYLYQKKSKVNSLLSWWNNVRKKAICLGIPYFVFSIATWLLKNVFSGAVNTQNDGLLESLFLNPASPYWYLYTLFFIFLITPTFAGRKSALAGLTFALVLNCIQAIPVFNINIYAFTQTCAKLIWFVLGMCLCVFDIPAFFRKKLWKRISIPCAVLFFGVSLLNFGSWTYSVAVTLLMGMLGCMSVFLVMLNWTGGKKLDIAADVFSKYTMPIYLMHTIFAAGIRAVLLKLGIDTPVVHIIIGLAVSFIGPVVAAWIMERIKLDILIYPDKYLKRKSQQGAKK